MFESGGESRVTDVSGVAGIVDGQDIEGAVIATVAYSDVFDFPVDRRDLHRFLVGVRASPAEVGRAVDRLVARGRLATGSHESLVFLPGRDEVLEVHRDRVARAAGMWPRAERWAGLMGRLPFVRMVAVTGGLACDSVADHDDIDYLVVTAPRRLWTARLMIVAVVRMARLLGDDLCPNYLVAEDSLTFDDRSLYVAREIVQSVPLVNPGLWAELRRRNRWTDGFVPNASGVWNHDHELDTRPGRLSRLMERVLGCRPMDRFEAWEMRRKVARLAVNPSRRPEVGRPDESSFSPSVCKGHMEGNAAGIDAAWRERLGFR